MSKIRVLIKRPGEKGRWQEIENDLATLQHTVGGYIETFTICTDLVVICNEEGRLLGLPFNAQICGYGFVGTVILAGIRGDAFADAPDAAACFLEVTT